MTKLKTKMICLGCNLPKNRLTAIVDPKDKNKIIGGICDKKCLVKWHVIRKKMTKKEDVDLQKMGWRRSIKALLTGTA